VGTRIKDIAKYLDELSISLRAYSKPLLKIIPQDGIVQMEVVDGLPEKIPFSEVYPQLARQSKEGLLPVYIGSSVSGQDMIFDLAQNPHMLVAGTTGSGKSVLLHTIIGNLLSFDDVETFLVDPKNIEFANYHGMKNVQVCNTFSQTMECLQSLEDMMEVRYEFMASKKMPVNFFVSDQKIFPKIVLIIDEFADLMLQDSGKDMHRLICKIAAKSRAAGVFCIIATQRPSVAVINGEIKANFPARISLKTASQIDSRIVLDVSGAECLSGGGDAIIHNYKFNYQRFQAAYSTSEELVAVYKHDA